MKRAISIAIVAVLASWLAAPALAVRSLVCFKQCCRRSPAARHSHCAEMDTLTTATAPSFRAVAGRCPGCGVQATPGRLMLASPTPNSIPSYNSARAIAVPDVEGAEPKLFHFAGRAPPLAA
jgi:hypothetical protein